MRQVHIHFNVPLLKPRVSILNLLIFDIRNVNIAYDRSADRNEIGNLVLF